MYEVVKTRDSCQPDQALEPSSSGKSFDDGDDNQEAGELFVPVKNSRKRQTTKEKLDATTTEVLNIVREAVSNDPTKELINFMREEMEKSRQHELRLFQMLQTQRANSGGHYQQATYPAIPYVEPALWHQGITQPGRGDWDKANPHSLYCQVDPMGSLLLLQGCYQRTDTLESIEHPST